MERKNGDAVCLSLDPTLLVSLSWIEIMLMLLLSRRWGYNGLWCDRSMLLEILYGHITDKSKIFTGKKVESIRHLKDSVEISTTDGSKYTGDIVVGTDGVHSRVRQEMVQYAKELGVAEDYTDDDRTFRALDQACLH
jgi:2-polyprenyl-6-methoxyphenol hydroxylase-like FAD-dependent oxidoreductase